MKKFAKSCFIAALSMLCVGSIILIICTFLGSATLYSYAKDNMPKFNFFDIDGHITIKNGEAQLDFSDDYPTYSNLDGPLQIASSEIRNLSLEIAGGKCVISESDDEYFHLTTESEHEYQYYVHEETLYIKAFDLSLQIPRDFLFENIDVELGIGMIDATSFNAYNNIEIEVGAGEFITHSLSSNTLSIEIGAGNAEIQNASTKISDFEIGLGNMSYSGIILDNLTAECSMGNLDLLLTDDYKDHNYHVECALGNITLNNNSFGGFVFSKDIQHEAKSTYFLECGMGNMNILFHQESVRDS